MVLVAVSGCPEFAHTVVVRVPDDPLQGPREVVIVRAQSMRPDAQGDVERSLDSYLRQAGFRVKRFVNLADISATEGGRSATVHEPLVRYALELDWSAKRCDGGGFSFDRFRVDVIDLKKNEIVMTTEATPGYSENCESDVPRSSQGKPFEGAFSGVAMELVKYWAPSVSGPKQPESSQVPAGSPSL